jgi:hypothetical protein
LASAGAVVSASARRVAAGLLRVVMRGPPQSRSSDRENEIADLLHHSP